MHTYIFFSLDIVVVFMRQSEKMNNNDSQRSSTNSAKMLVVDGTDVQGFDVTNSCVSRKKNFKYLKINILNLE